MNKELHPKVLVAQWQAEHPGQDLYELAARMSATLENGARLTKVPGYYAASIMSLMGLTLLGSLVASVEKDIGLAQRILIPLTPFLILCFMMNHVCRLPKRFDEQRRAIEDECLEAYRYVIELDRLVEYLGGNLVDKEMLTLEEMALENLINRGRGLALLWRENVFEFDMFGKGSKYLAEFKEVFACFTDLRLVRGEHQRFVPINV